jgi:hypothetical protein
MTVNSTVWQPPLLLQLPPLCVILPSQERGSHLVGVYPSSSFGVRHSNALSDRQLLQHANMSQSRHWKARCRSCVICCPPPLSPNWTVHNPVTPTFSPPNDPAKHSSRASDTQALMDQVRVHACMTDLVALMHWHNGHPVGQEQFVSASTLRMENDAVIVGVHARDARMSSDDRTGETL